MKKSLTYGMVTLGLLWALNTQAAVFDGSVNITPLQVKQSGPIFGGTSSWDSTYTTIKAGALLGPWYVGVAGDFENKNYERKAFGVVVGARYMGLVADAIVYPVATAKPFLSGGSELTDGFGLGVDLGYQAPLEPVYVGFTVSYRQFGYKKIKTGSVSVDSKNDLSSIQPQISIGLRF